VARPLFDQPDLSTGHATAHERGNSQRSRLCSNRLIASIIGWDFDLSVLSAELEQDELELSDLLESATMAR
jgi:hypothetical protein